MANEVMMIARIHLNELGDEGIEALLDLIEDPSRPTTTETFTALRRFLKDLEAELGEDHEAILQVQRALALADSHASAGNFRSSGTRIS